MGEWKTYRLEELCTAKGSYGIGAPAVAYDVNKYTYLRITDINDDGTLNHNGLMSVDDERAGDYLLKENDIVFARTGNSTGRTYFYDGRDGELVYAGFLIKFSLDSEKVNPRILKYYTHSQPYYDWVRSFDTGGTRGNINAKVFGAMPITLPPRHQQDRIVEILKSLDDKIELNRRLNANLEAQAQALFRSWFVDFEPFRDGPFVDSELGKIPQGWKVGNYTDIVEIKGGGTPKTGIQEYWDGTIPFFSPKDVGASCFVLDTEKRITAKGLENCNSSLFQPNTVFITARGTVGKVVMTGAEMAMNQTNYALLGKQNISQYYVYHITLQLVARLLKKANGAVFNAITTRDFTSEQIIIPPFATIRQFSDVVKPIYENILLNDVQSNRLSALRDTLLPKLMAGEINLH